jgi:hypothetical protein
MIVYGYTTLLENYSTLFFFLWKPGEFNEALLHQTTLNLHTHVRIFSHLSIATVDGKQHLNEVMFSALVECSLKGKWHEVGGHCLWIPVCPGCVLKCIEKSKSYSRGNKRCDISMLFIQSKHYFSSQLLSGKLRIKIYIVKYIYKKNSGTCDIWLKNMDSYIKVDYGHLKIGSWGEYLGPKDMRMRKFIECTVHLI